MIRIVLITNMDILKLFLGLYFQKGIRQSSSMDIYVIILPVYQICVRSACLELKFMVSSGFNRTLILQASDKKMVVKFN